MQRFVLTLSGPDRMGIVASVAGFLFDHECNIVESAQFGDPATMQFFMRVSFDSSRPTSAERLRHSFEPVGVRFSLEWAIHDTASSHGCC